MSDISVGETKNTKISINIDGLLLTTRYISAHLHPRLRSIGQITIARRLPRRMLNITISDTRMSEKLCENNEWAECAFTASLVLIPKIIMNRTSMSVVVELNLLSADHRGCRSFLVVSDGVLRRDKHQHRLYLRRSGHFICIMVFP